MILVDTSIWIDHLHKGDDVMDKLLSEDAVMMHPFVYGEIAMGSLKDRRVILAELAKIPAAPVAKDAEVMEFIETARLFGTGIGFIDAHLLASAKLQADGLVWTRDRRLQVAAEELGIDATTV